MRAVRPNRRRNSATDRAARKLRLPVVAMTAKPPAPPSTPSVPGKMCAREVPKSVARPQHFAHYAGLGSSGTYDTRSAYSSLRRVATLQRTTVFLSPRSTDPINGWSRATPCSVVTAANPTLGFSTDRVTLCVCTTTSRSLCVQ